MSDLAVAVSSTPTATVHYRLTVYIDPKWVSRFREHKLNLCTAFGVQSSHSKTRYNIIASSEEPTPLNTISWVESYHIAGCKTGFDDGAYVFPNTIPTPISTGQTYSLNSDWSHTAPNSIKGVPHDSFAFVSEVPACGLLFKQIRNRQRPIYLSSLDHALAPPGKHVLQTTGTILVFFAKDGQDQQAFDVDAVSTACFELSYATSGQPTTNISYNDLGVFSLVETVPSEANKGLPARLMKHFEDLAM